MTSLLSGARFASAARTLAAKVKVATTPWTTTAEQQEPLGRLPALSLVSALGLLCISVSNNLSGSGVLGLEPYFWLGLVTIIGPITARLLSAKAARPERIGLALLFVLDMHLVKLLQSPYAFTYSDELIHSYNATQIFNTARLFGQNALLPATPLYPGLESVTAALMRLAGLDVFGAGLVVILVSRITMALALFLLYERVSGSARIASLATILYGANPNFLFWSSQFSYESLALPLAILVLFVVARRDAAGRATERSSLTLVAIAGIAAVVVTHHLSSYFLAAILSLWAIFASRPGRALIASASQRIAQLGARSGQRFGAFLLKLAGRPAGPAAQPEASGSGPGGLALFAVVAALFWLMYAAGLTLQYLSPVFSGAIQALINTIAGEETGRALFQSSSSGGYVAPIWERMVGIGSILLCLAALPFGLRQVWQRKLHHALVLLLALAAVAYFALLGLRFIPKAWEIANRSSEFLFIGLALILAMARMPRWIPLRRLQAPLMAVAVAVIFAGGVIAGWKPQLRLQQVYEVSIGNIRLEPAGLTAARWVHEHLGPGHTFAADDANGGLLLAYGQQNVLIGATYSVRRILRSDSFEDWQLSSLQKAQIDYLAVDRRLVSNDNMAGNFFDRGRSWPLPEAELFSTASYEKFDELPRVSRIFDSGDLVLYDLQGWINAAPQP